MERTAWAAIGLIGTAVLLVAAFGHCLWRRGWWRRTRRAPTPLELAMIAGGRKRVELAYATGMRVARASGETTNALYRATLDETPRTVRRAGWIWADPAIPRDQPSDWLSILLGGIGLVVYATLYGLTTVLWPHEPSSGLGWLLNLATLVATACLGFLLWDRPRRTRAGERALAAAGAHYRDLPRRVCTPTEATLLAALGGPAALRELDARRARRIPSDGLASNGSTVD